MAIDESDVMAGVAASSSDERVPDASESDGSGDLSLDELRLRLDSPLYARESGLAAPMETPGLRELTWEHITNPTISQPVVSPADGDGTPRPAPIRIEDLLARPDIALAPMAPIAAPVMPSGPTEVVAPMAPDLDPTPSGLPSLASMMAAVPADSTAPYDSTDSDGADQLVKPIEEPPPVAHDTDPMIVGLADLIVKSTPGTGMPRVEALRDSLERGNSEIVPVIDGMSSDPPVLDAKVEFANASTAVPVVSAPTPPEPMPTPVASSLPNPVVAPPPPPPAPPSTAAAAVQAEMNRLAFLPDQEDDLDHPVEVPAIASTDVRIVQPGSPVSAPTAAPTGPTLSAGQAYQARPSTAAVRHNYSSLLNTTSVPVPQRRKRHVMRKFASVLVLLALVAGGLFAVKFFVLDRVSWSKELEPLAKDVEAARKLEFDKNVAVTALPVAVYATRLASSSLGLDGATPKARDGVWRSLGLLNGTLEPGAVGLTALVDEPAFYDPSDRAIYVVDGLDPEWRTYALHRALTMALLDQHFDWSGRLVDVAPTVARGTLALYDADAIAVADSLLDPDSREAVATQSFTAYSKYEVPVASSPFATATTGRLGLAVSPYLASLTTSQRDQLELNAAFTDGQLLDLRRVTGNLEATVAATSEGMLFWYHALASRVDTDLAWKAALAWQTDEVAGSVKVATFCTEASLSFDAASAEVVTAAFTAWAAAAPAGGKSAAQFEPVVGGLLPVKVQACDAGAAATAGAPKARLSLGGAPLRAEQFRQLRVLHPEVPQPQVACSVYGADPLTKADDRNMVDPVGGWAAPKAHPVPDPSKGPCAAP